MSHNPTMTDVPEPDERYRVTIPLALYERMALCYYGGGPTFSGARTIPPPVISEPQFPSIPNPGVLAEPGPPVELFRPKLTPIGYAADKIRKRTTPDAPKPPDDSRSPT